MRPADLEGWVPLDGATGAFERPAWAIRALIEQGKLERTEIQGKTYVRRPRPEAPARGTPPPEVAARASGEAPGPVGAAPATSLAEALAFLIEEGPRPREDRTTSLAPSGTSERPAGTLRLEDLASDVEELLRASRAREAFLVRAAQALIAVETSARRALPAPPEPAPRSFAGAALGLAGLGIGLSVAFGFAVRELDRERDRSATVHERLDRLERTALRPAEPAPSPSGAPAASAASAAPTATLAVAPRVGLEASLAVNTGPGAGTASSGTVAGPGSVATLGSGSVARVTSASVAAATTASSTTLPAGFAGARR